MIELLLSLLLSVGILAPVEEISAHNQINRPDERPRAQDVECFVGCFGYCLWPGMPDV